MGFAEAMESLKGFDPNDLDFNNAGSWPGPVKGIVLLLLFVGILAAGYFFLIKDQYMEYDRVASEESELKEQYENKAFKVRNLEAFRTQMDEMQKSFGALLKQLPAKTEVPGLLEDITNTGLGSGLEIKSIQLKPEDSKEFYIELPMEIEVAGTYHDIASFVSGVASLPRIVTLHDLNIVRVKDDGDSQNLVMTVSAKTYRYGGETAGLGAKTKKRRKK